MLSYRSRSATQTQQTAHTATPPTSPNAGRFTPPRVNDYEDVIVRHIEWINEHTQPANRLAHRPHLDNQDQPACSAFLSGGKWERTSAGHVNTLGASPCKAPQCFGGATW